LAAKVVGAYVFKADEGPPDARARRLVDEARQAMAQGVHLDDQADADIFHFL
jgi:hypothetical protein